MKTMTRVTVEIEQTEDGFPEEPGCRQFRTMSANTMQWDNGFVGPKTILSMSMDATSDALRLLKDEKDGNTNPFPDGRVES